ncbi:hypothetical protein CAPTEDRAFT_189554 [Capitella teleta]|uniref:Uncharacterized protein n=1 Tax=Capitella teleta TaxID=283909 RepID=R7UHL7_CAPTE|nr:hypothetical protein CAPTEDRAFT_189554 [Capitella teleta]|eukprot:ELU05705.1 hypothetical protein CAPTEDRAFT_189554 [Capitella teleta]
MTTASDSLLLLIFVVCVGLALSIAQWTFNINELFLLVFVAKLALISLMAAAGSLGIWLFRRPPHIHSQLEHSMSQKTDEDNIKVWKGSCWFRLKLFIWSKGHIVRRMFKYHVALVGLLVFCVLGLIVDFIKVSAIAVCFVEYSENGHFMQWYTADFFYHLSRMFSLPFCCCAAIPSTTPNSSPVVAFGTPAPSSWPLLSSLDWTFFCMTFSTDINKTLGDCIACRTNLFEAYHRSSRILYSLNVEFVVLATEVLIHIMLGIQNKSNRTASNATLLYDLKPRDTWRHAFVFKIVIYMCFFTMNAVHMTSATLTYFSINTFFRVSRWIFHCMTLTALTIGFQASWRMPTSSRPFSGFECLAVAACIGNTIWGFMNLFAEIVILLSTDNHNVSQASQVSGILANIINIISVFAQAKFMLHSTRVKADRCGEAKLTRFRAALLCLAINNLTLWCINSLILNKVVTATQVPAKYYSSSSWTIMVHLTVPLCLFFRFNSFALFLKTFFVQDYSSNVDVVLETKAEPSQQLAIACTSASRVVTQY